MHDVYESLSRSVGKTVVLASGPVVVPIKVASIRRAGVATTVVGHTLGGQRVEHTITAAGKPVVAPWALRLASVIRVADWDATHFDPIVKDLITQAGLPVDHATNWDKVLHSLFNRAGVATKDPELRSDLIQQALVTLVIRRSLEKFDPSAVQTDDPEYTTLPLEQKVGRYVVQLINWQLKRELQVHLKKYHSFSDDTDEHVMETLPAEADHGVADSESDLGDLASVRAAFADYVAARRQGDLRTLVMQLFDLVTTEPTGKDVARRWEEVTGKSFQYMRRVLAVMREDLLAFAKTQARTSGDPFFRIVNDLRLRSQGAAKKVHTPDADLDSVLIPAEPEQPAAARASSVTHDPLKIASFMRSLQSTVVRLATEGAIGGMKTAKPKVVDSSTLFVVVEGNQLNYLNMNIRFGGPSIAKNPGAGTEYTIDVGMYGPDRSLPETKIKKQLNALVFPSMRSDVPEEFHNLLEKVIRELRAIVWENAVEFFDLPKEARSAWRHVIRMNVLTLQDVKVSIAEDGVPREAAAYPSHPEAPKESSMTAPAKFASLKRIAAETPEVAGEKIEAIKQKLLDQVEMIDAFQSHMDMSPEAEEKFAGFKRAAEEEPEEFAAALSQFFVGLDEIMADTEALADDLGVELVLEDETRETQGEAAEEATEEETDESTPDGDVVIEVEA